MKHLSFSHLPEIGIEPLTGEACAYCMRTLCDLNEEGVQLMADYLGLPVHVNLSMNWNSQVNGKPSVASIMIQHEMFDAIIRFALFRANWQYVYGQTNGYTAFNDSDIEENPTLALFMKEGGSDFMPGRLYRNPRSKQPSEGSRNVHAMTGRSL